MAVSHTPVFVQTPKVTPQSFVNADGTGKKTIFTAGTNGAKVVGVLATSTDTVARVAQLWLTRSATSYLLTSQSIPAASGSDGATPSVDISNGTIWPGLPVDNDGQAYIFLETGDTLQVSFTVAVTAAKEIDIITVCANF